MKSQDFINIYQLLRLNAPTGNLHIIKIIYLTFFPACYGLFLSGSKNYYYLLLFFIGSITTRGMGCIINDYFDRNLDIYVARTKNRPLASGSVSLRFALIVFLVCSVLSLLILLTLTTTAIYLGLISSGMILFYPLFKRFTYFPQVFLGFTFNMGALIGYASIANNISYSALILYTACVCWTVGFDTIYGFMDIVDDKKIKIKSLSILLENNNYQLWIGFLYIIFIILFNVAILSEGNYLYFWPILVSSFIALIILLWQILTLDINQPKNCLQRFNSNNLVGVILMMGFFCSH